MKHSVKTIIDIIMGAVIPIIILDRFSGPEWLGAVAAYILAALVPVAWVFIDLFFITKRFNFITSYIGFSSIVSGLLAFWFVDGFLFAVKDTVGFVLRALVFGISLLLGKPILKYFFIQAVNPENPGQEKALDRLFGERSVFQSFIFATWLVVTETLVAGVINFYLNLQIVVAAFGTELFNQQVAQVNAITRIALGIPTWITFAAALWLMYRAIYKHLPSEEGKPQLESDFWDLVAMREARS